AAVLRLLPEGVRVAAPTAVGDRPARRLAPNVAPRARTERALAVGRGARGGCAADRGRRRLEPGRAARLHVLGVRPGGDRPRVRARDTGEEGTRCGDLGGRIP